MRWPVVAMLLASSALFVPVARGERPGDAIAQVLDRSQRVQLDRLLPAGATPAAQVLQEDFDALVRTLAIDRLAELRVVKGESVGETFQGRYVVVDESIAAFPKGERYFVLAHELGHVALGHWARMEGLYRKWIPGEVAPATTDPVAGPLGREASALAHEQEFQADAFALHTLRALGRPEKDALSTFLHLGLRGDTVTHPGTRQRMAALEQLMHAEARVAQTNEEEPSVAR